jgi:arylsulfatase A-like enzyme
MKMIGRMAWLFIAVAVVIGLFGFAMWHFYPARLLAIADRIRSPIAKSHPVHWAKGPATPPAGRRPPNIILIVADDLGINDLTATGTGVAGGAVPTPNIDAIAQQGAMFDCGYAASATCSPSRAAMMTGRYAARFGFEYAGVPALLARGYAKSERHALRPPIYHADRERDMPPSRDLGMPAGQITIAEALKARGYHTLHIGKWHLGESPPMRPENQGFDESLGFMPAASKYGPDSDPALVSARLDYDPIDRFLWEAAPDAVQWNGGQRFHVPYYMTDYFAEEASRAITANRNRPFFLYLAFNAPHTPFQALKSDYDALGAIKDHKIRVYGAMVRALDRGVGRVMATLKAEGLDQNALVIFTSDNGGAWYAGVPDINRPYRGWKATFFEGGIRVPLFVRWPGHIDVGQRLRAPAHQMDLFATAAAAAGASMPTDRRMDSVNLLPLITGATSASIDRPLFWSSGPYRVVRAGDWKLQIGETQKRTWLFNLATDPTERTDLSARESQIVARLRGMIAAHEAQMPRPLWPALVEMPIRIDVPLNAPWKPNQAYVYWSN